jgi:light-regulated signal transduction histidine kinase (bacteriophytochrome)
VLDTLQRLLEIPAADVKVVLPQACDAVAAALDANKVDAFMYDSQSDLSRHRRWKDREGIAPDVLPRTFRAIRRRQGRKGGLGLGRYLVKRTATLHNGDIAVESKPGQMVLGSHSPAVLSRGH